MKYSVSIKFLAVLLCAVTLLCAIGAGSGLAALAGTGILSGKTVDEVKEESLRPRLRQLAMEAVRAWAETEYGEMPPEVAEASYHAAKSSWIGEDACTFIILDEDNGLLYSNHDGREAEKSLFYFGAVSYDHFLGWTSDSTKEEVTEPDADRWYTRGVYSEETGQMYHYYAREEFTDDVRVELYITHDSSEDAEWSILRTLEHRKTLLAAVLVGSLLLFAIGAVYLCCSAGRRPGSDEVRAAGLNAVPLDLYALGILGETALAVLVLDEFEYSLMRMEWQGMVAGLGAMAFVSCLLFVGFCFACAAQFKMKNYHWWWNSLCGRCLKAGFWGMKLMLKFLSKAVPAVAMLALRLVKDAWKITMALLTFGFGVVQKCWRWFIRYVRRVLAWVDHFFSLLPLTWQWLLIGSGIIILLAVTAHGHGGNGIVFGILVSLAVIFYGANCFGTLMEAVKKLRSGELEAKVDDKFLVGSFREFAGELNGLADVAMVAAQKQLKSERMKTELITNVSHDIKTPLTSIINYVDLLEKPHTPEAEKAYLEVLHRQSQRMKKLIEDLMEMSKASTGNIPVEIVRIDAVEAVNQALGEFADKLSSAGLIPVFHPSEEELFLLADGRLLWRAMSNVLSNAVKYSLPGTRLYVDVAAAGNTTVISFKNISGAQLNISADELMERFVRGDSSRNTEGSGLGLNITKSLMELQKGQLQLLVDGDLFKVTLVFPKAE